MVDFGGVGGGFKFDLPKIDLPKFDVGDKFLPPKFNAGDKILSPKFEVGDKIALPKADFGGKISLPKADQAEPVPQLRDGFKNLRPENKDIAIQLSRGNDPKRIPQAKMDGFVRELTQPRTIAERSFDRLSKPRVDDQLEAFTPGTRANARAWREFRDEAKQRLVDKLGDSSGGALSAGDARGVVDRAWQGKIKVEVREAFNQRLSGAAREAFKLPPGASFGQGAIVFADGKSVTIKNIEGALEMIGGLTKAGAQSFLKYVREEFGTTLGLDIVKPAKPGSGGKPAALNAGETLIQIDTGSLRVTDSSLRDSRGQPIDPASRVQLTLRDGVIVRGTLFGDTFARERAYFDVPGQRASYVIEVTQVGGSFNPLEPSQWIGRIGSALGFTVAGAQVAPNVPIPRQADGSITFDRTQSGLTDNGNPGSFFEEEVSVNSGLRVTVYTRDYFNYLQDVESYRQLGLTPRGGPVYDMYNPTANVVLPPLIDPRQ